MIHMTLTDVAKLLHLTMENNTLIHGVSIDSRTLQPGNLFIAIAGDHVDGHDYVKEAAEKGASALIVSKNVNSSLPQLLVQDTTQALGLLGAAWRNQFNIPLVAVTGSNGKTTTKNMLASIMKAACHGEESAVLATKGTLNNHWGLPLTLAGLNEHHHYAAVEMGMNHFGEIAYLTQLARPDVAIITNAGESHLEGVGDVAGVARAKAEIFSGLPKNGIAILNKDDVFFDYWCQQIGSHAKLTFALHSSADVTATLHKAQTSQHITLRTPKGNIEVHLPLLGKHNVLNALAAATAALAINIDLTAIKCGLEAVEPAAGRLQLHTLQNGVNLIDDTYNANPFSLDAAVETLTTFEGKKILVLGDMRELGVDAKSLHEAAGKKIRQAGIDCLFTYGELSENAAHTFGEGGFHFTEQEKLINALKPFLHNQTTILIKGSRSMKMERVLAGLVQ
jgi:UDP-N-acetylmuramoyl-tripeptide--D-alanyl-D-alanine ligase